MSATTIRGRMKQLTKTQSVEYKIRVTMESSNTTETYTITLRQSDETEAIRQAKEWFKKQFTVDCVTLQAVSLLPPRYLY